MNAPDPSTTRTQNRENPMSTDKWDIAPHQPAGPSSRRRAFDTIATAARAHPSGLDAAVRDLDQASLGFDTAVARMMDARPALPGAASYDGPTSRSSNTSSTTEKHATTPDRTANDRATLDAMLRHLSHDTSRLPNADLPRITRNAWTLRRLISAWTPRPPSPKDQRQVSDANTVATECALTREHLGLYASVHVRSNLKGLLPDAEPVGLWVWRFARSHRRLPSPMEWRQHASVDDDLRTQVIERSRRAKVQA